MSFVITTISTHHTLLMSNIEDIINPFSNCKNEDLTVIGTHLVLKVSINWGRKEESASKMGITPIFFYQGHNKGKNPIFTLLFIP